MKINYIDIPKNTVGILVEYNTNERPSEDIQKFNNLFTEMIMNSDSKRQKKYLIPTENNLISDITIITKE